MNYDELLSVRDSENAVFCQLPLGKLTRRNVDGKYLNVVDIRAALCSNVLFDESLKYECKAVGLLKPQHQLRFMVGGDDVKGDTGMTLVVERGVYVTLAQLLYETPSLVAKDKFLDNIISQAFEAANALSAQNIWHLCYSPQNVLVRRGDNQLLLLNHGSFYRGLSDQNEFYAGMADYVAPEVLSHGTIDERSEIYSLGKFIQSLYAMASMPFEVKRMIKKATAPVPEDRYSSLDEMKKALSRMRSARQTVTTFAVAAVAALVLIWGYFSVMPEQSDMEYVKPAPKDTEEELLDEGFDPVTELGFIPSDTTTTLTPEQKKKMAEYEKKAEDIFRKRYEREADRILSKLYNKSNKGMTDKKFRTTSQQTFEELTKAQEEIASQTALPLSKTQRIATEIINKVTDAKKKEFK